MSARGVGMHIEAPSGIEGLSIVRDLPSGRWDVRGFGVTTVLRPWTFGERRRLLQTCVGPTGFDDGRFLAAFNRLVYAPTPPEALAALFAHVALCLFEVDERTATTQVEADLRLARELGILPSRSDGEPAPELDRLIRGLEAPVPGAEDRIPPMPDHGWTRIVVVDDG